MKDLKTYLEKLCKMTVNRAKLSYDKIYHKEVIIVWGNKGMRVLYEFPKDIADSIYDLSDENQAIEFRLTPKTVIKELNGIIASNSGTKEQLVETFNKLKGITISDFHAYYAFNLVFNWREYASNSKDLNTAIMNKFKEMGCNVVYSEYLEYIL